MGGGDAPRGGTRGGKDQFNWDDVKGDKDREYYLGHSLKASVGRWQRGKDILWYTREKEKDGGAQMSDADRAKAEIAAIKAAEEQSMAEALGLKPRTEHHVTHATLEKHEMDELLRRGTTKDERTDDVDAARVKGLGVQGIAGQHGGAGREIMEGVGLSDDDEDERRRAAIGQKRSREMVEVPPPPRAPLRMTDKELRKEKKRAKKEAKKAKKRAKKEAKRAKKDAKRRGRSRRRRRRPRPHLEVLFILGLKRRIATTSAPSAGPRPPRRPPAPRSSPPTDPATRSSGHSPPTGSPPHSSRSRSRPTRCVDRTASSSRIDPCPNAG